MKTVLILSNMGPSERHPNAGRFVNNQYQALLASKSEFSFEFFYLSLDKKHFFQAKFRYLWFFLRFVFTHIFSRKRLDIIHVHFFFPTAILAAVYKLFRNPRVKIITTFHGSDIYSYSPPNWLYRKIFSLVDNSIFVSKGLLQRFPLPVKEHQVLSAGFANVFRQQEGQHKEYDLLFIGNLEYVKGADRLVELLKRLPETVNTLVIGDGRYGPAVKEMADASNNVDYRPLVEPETLVALINQSKMLLNLSRSESFGLVFCEAIACGTPVFATRTDGANELILEGKNGWVTENDETLITTQFVDRIIQALEQAPSRLDHDVQNRVERHRLTHVSDQLLQLYRSVI